MKTMKEIAEACNVSVSLVSRIINRDPSLKCRHETIEKVIREVEANNYIPNQNARALAKSTTKDRRKITIGYVTYKGDNNTLNAYFESIVEGVVTILNADKYQVYCFYIDEVFDKYINHQPLASKILDGLIIFGTIEDRLLNYLSHQSKYISTIYGDSMPNYDSVGTDINSSLNQMLDLIKEYGYKNIGFVHGNDKARNANVEEYANKIGIEFDEKFTFDGKNVTKTAHDKMNLLLKDNKPPKCICCMNDEMAIGIIRALRENNYNVPQDVSVTGHDDIMKASYCEVPITTVRIFKEEIGRLITDLLLERINYLRKFPVKVLVPCEIVMRDSLIRNKED